MDKIERPKNPPLRIIPDEADMLADALMREGFLWRKAASGELLRHHDPNTKRYAYHERAAEFFARAREIRVWAQNERRGA